VDNDHSPSPDQDKTPGQTHAGGFASFWQELNRGKVMREAIIFDQLRPFDTAQGRRNPRLDTLMED